MVKDRELNFHELLCYVLKKWRIIIIIAVIVALIAGASKIVTGLRNNTNDSVNLSGDALATKNNIENELIDLQSDLEDLAPQIEYKKNSILMNIDPFNAYEGAFVICVDTNYQINPSLSYQDADITKQIVSAYSAYLKSNEFYSYIFDNSKYNKDIDGQVAYLAELINVSYDYDAATVSVRCYGEKEARVQEIVELAQQAIEAKCPEIQDTVGSHECSIFMKFVGSVVDRDLAMKQKDNIKEVNDIEKRISDKQEELDALYTSAKPQVLSKSQILVSAIKGSVFGGIVGLGLAIVGFMVLGVLSNKMWGDSAWSSFEIPIVGEVYLEKEHRKFEKADKWLAKVFGYASPDISTEKSAALSGTNVMATLKLRGTSSVAVISPLNSELGSRIVAGMNNENSSAFRFAGDMLLDSAAIAKIADSEEVVLLADGGRIAVDEVNKIINLLGTWGKKLLGVILIK